MSSASLSSTESENTANRLSSDSENDSSVSLSHRYRNHRRSKSNGYFRLSLESLYSSTNSRNHRGDTQGSWSHGSSNRSSHSRASTVSTQSIILVEPSNFFANSNDDQSISLRSVSDKHSRKHNRAGNAAKSIVWDGDSDNEYIFGTYWSDMLSGAGGDDILYGFEGDDTIIGGDGADRIFGDAGDDTIHM